MAPRANNTSDAANDMATLSSYSHPSCDLLDKLPAEMRNNIYEAVFAQPIRDCQLDLRNKPPGTALVSTCKQIRRETRGMYSKVRADYWVANEFAIKIIPNGYTRYISFPVSRAEVRSIEKNITIQEYCPIVTEYMRREIRLVDHQGLWRVCYPSTRDYSHIQLRFEPRHNVVYVEPNAGIGPKCAAWPEETPVDMQLEALLKSEYGIECGFAGSQPSSFSTEIVGLE